MTQRAPFIRIFAAALIVALAAFVFVGCTASSSSSDLRPGMATPQPIAAGESLVIPLSGVSETVSFYPVEVDGTVMEVLAVQAPDGTVRTAFNTCEICYDSGLGYYSQQGSDLVCANCGNHFAMTQVEVEAGGCNPWPIFPEDKSVTADAITIDYDFLKSSEQVFANWVS